MGGGGGGRACIFMCMCDHISVSVIDSVYPVRVMQKLLHGHAQTQSSFVNPPKPVADPRLDL